MVTAGAVFMIQISWENKYEFYTFACPYGIFAA
jgi:hypothetical protein